jgi:preprotein translocase subunit SecG
VLFILSVTLPFRRGKNLIYLNIAQILVSVVLVLIILSQVKESGSGLFGSAQSTVRTRRGLEKTLFQFTIALAVLFIVVSIISVGLFSG